MLYGDEGSYIFHLENPSYNSSFYLILLLAFASFIFLAIEIKASFFNFMVKSWLEDEMERSKKDLARDLCFTVKLSTMDFYRLFQSNHTELKGYLLDSPEGFSQKVKSSCRFRAFRYKKFVPNAYGEQDPTLSNILNDDEHLRELINRTRTRLNGLYVHFSPCENPFSESEKGLHAWVIGAPVSPFMTNSKEQMEHIIRVVERIAYLIRTALPKK